METLSDKIKQKRIPFCSAVIVAGGSSVRFGADKLFAEISGSSVLARSIRAFASCEFIQEIVLVVREEILPQAQSLAQAIAGPKLRAVVPGGSTRAQSSFAGVMAVSPAAELVAIHDGARPLVSHEVILDALWGAHRHHAAAPAVPVKDTIKIASDRVVTETPDRSRLYAVQTPQVFRCELIKAALTSAMEKQTPVTDDCSAAEAIGIPVYLTEGSEENIKITTPLDLELSEAILRRRLS